MTRRTRGLIAINVGALLFGSAALYGKLAASPVWIVAARAACAAATLGLIARARREHSLPPPPLRARTAATGAALALHWVSFFAAVQEAGVAVATLTFAVFPLFTVLIESRAQRRRPRGAELAAGAAIVAAVALLVDPRGHGGRLGGAFCGLFSALAFAWFSHSSKRLGEALSPLRVSLWVNAAVTLLLVPFLFFSRPVPSGPAAWLCLAFLGIVGTALMHQLYFYALNRLSAATCGGFVALEPVYAILLAALFFGEPVTGWVAVSAALIVGASFALLRLEGAPALE